MKTYEEHYSEMNDLVKDLLEEAKKNNIDLSKINIVEGYGRLSLLYFYNLVKDVELHKPTNNNMIDADSNDYTQMKLISNTYGSKLAYEFENNENVNTNPSSFINENNDMLYLIKESVTNNNWHIDIESPFIETFTILPYLIAEYMANLLGTDINMIRRYDVRTVIQISSKEIMNISTPWWLIKHDDETETDILLNIIIKKFNISLPSLKREIDKYIREHLKTTPKHSNKHWSVFVKKIFNRS